MVFSPSSISCGGGQCSPRSLRSIKKTFYYKIVLISYQPTNMKGRGKEGFILRNSEYFCLKGNLGLLDMVEINVQLHTI